MKKIVLFLLTMLILISAFSKGLPNFFVYNSTSEVDTLLIEFIAERLGLDSNQTFIIRFTSEMSTDVKGFIVPANSFSEHQVFHICLKIGLDQKTIERTLIHELVHASQYISGDLQKVDTYLYIWKNRKYDLDRTTYFNRPWEMEARYLEDKLFTMFKRRHNSEIIM